VRMIGMERRRPALDRQGLALVVDHHADRRGGADVEAEQQRHAYIGSWPDRITTPVSSPGLTRRSTRPARASRSRDPARSSWIAGSSPAMTSKECVTFIASWLAQAAHLVHEALDARAVDRVPGVAVDLEMRADDGAVGDLQDVGDVVEVDAGVSEDRR